MSKIRLLPDTVANQIAAGEVVERPASVVKELLENSLDAGSSRVDVAIERGGKNLIRVRDDGEGMTRDDTLLAFERHTTSKIRSVDDLHSLVTFGFRGEALASIASVARITLRSKLRDDVAGTELDIEGGTIRSVRDAAWPGGTEIVIRDLFFNVPARRKFMKSETTESYHVTNLVTHYALANPGLSFSLTNNGRETIRVTPATDLRERAYQLFGETFLDALVPVEFHRDGTRVTGFVSRPQDQRSTREAQYLFVNGRYVKDRLVSRAIGEAYRNVIPPGTFPSVMLFLELPPDQVDVNVHPQKTEVRFQQANTVHDTVREAVRRAVGADNRPFAHFPQLVEKPETSFDRPADPAASVSDIEAPIQPPLRSAAPPLDRNFKAEFSALVRSTAVEEVSPAPVQPPPFFATESPLPDEPPPVSPAERAAERFLRAAQGLSRTGKSLCDSVVGDRTPILGDPLELPRADVRILGQFHNSYIIAADARGLLLLDQHAVHERILFEQHLRRLMARSETTQAVLVPETLDLTPAQAVAFEQIAEELEANGFDCMRLSGRTIALRGRPADLSADEARALLLELLDGIAGDPPGLRLEHFQREIAAGLACRAAIKVNTPLTMEKMAWLVDELLKAENPTNCPHGRPVLLRFDRHEIERGFKRI